MDEIADANKNSIVSKQVKYQKERDEEEKIHQYNIEKAQKDAEYLADQRFNN